MHSKLIFLILFFIFLNSCSRGFSTAQQAPDSTLASVTAAQGQSFTDSEFGTEILKVTDQTDGTDCGVSYSYWPTFNKNSTQLILNCNNQPLLYTFNPQSFTVSEKTKLFKDKNLNFEDAIWSSTDSNIIFAHDFNQLYTYNTQTETSTSAGNIQSLLPQGHHIGQMSKSLDNNIFAFTEKDADYKNAGYIVYQKNLNKIIYRVATTQLDEVQIDKSGRYLTIKTGLEATGQIRVIIVDLQTGKTTNLKTGAPDYAAGHSDNGHGFTIGGDNYNNSLQYRSLSNPYETRDILSFKNDWTQALHVSLLANDESQALISTYSTSREPGLYHSEIFLVATDGSQNVRHLVKHQSAYASYYDSPRANISRDGRFVAYTSNGGTSIRSVYIARVSADESPAPTPVPQPVPPSQPAHNILAHNAYLTAGQALRSSNGRYYLVYQHDGNLVVYRDDSQVMWAASINGQPGFAIMQSDGNFVVYNGSGQAVWSSGTQNSNAYLSLDDNGKLRVVSGGRVLWETP